MLINSRSSNNPQLCMDCGFIVFICWLRAVTVNIKVYADYYTQATETNNHYFTKAISLNLKVILIFVIAIIFINLDI